MNKNEVKKLIEKGESESLELKLSLSQIKEIIQTIAGFANKNGGKIIIGVSFVGNISGLQTGKDTIERLTNKISTSLEPKVYPKIEVKEIVKKRIIIIDIDEAKEKPVFAFGRAFKRVGKSTLRMSKEETEKLILERKKVYWDEQVCEDATLQDIDEDKVKWFLRKAKHERNFDIETEIPIKEVLERLRLIKNRKLINASILLFGKDPQKFFLQAKIRCARFKGTAAVDFIDMKLIEKSIIDQVDEAEKFVLSHIKKAAKIVMFKREEVWEYPPDALREAIVNAVCHRDYSIHGNIKIAILDDRIEISNPGRLPESLTPSLLKRKHDSILRNPSIANNFFLIKNIEQWGRGTNKIVQWCVEHGLKEPDFNEIGGGFEVKFYAPEDILKLIPEKGKIDLRELGLNKRQIEALRSMVNKGVMFTNKKYREHFKVGGATAKRDLMKLLKLGLVERVGTGRAIKYKGGK
ncbi:helix-turn-helix domain-containing protein [Patescibacteria group bacterium AH-259-L07]|nr:helix-turn-helix domain-containing protein [Patescibacteria group bacterium AH-259-L07]